MFNFRKRPSLLLKTNFVRYLSLLLFFSMEDSNRNSIPRTMMREGTPPTFLTAEQSRSLPRGMPLFSTPEQGNNKKTKGTIT